MLKKNTKKKQKKKKNNNLEIKSREVFAIPLEYVESIIDME